MSEYVKPTVTPIDDAETKVENAPRKAALAKSDTFLFASQTVRENIKRLLANAGYPQSLLDIVSFEGDEEVTDVVVGIPTNVEIPAGPGEQMTERPNSTLEVRFFNEALVLISRSEANQLVEGNKIYHQYRRLDYDTAVKSRYPALGNGFDESRTKSWLLATPNDDKAILVRVANGKEKPILGELRRAMFGSSEVTPLSEALQFTVNETTGSKALATEETKVPFVGAQEIVVAPGKDAKYVLGGNLRNVNVSLHSVIEMINRTGEDVKTAALKRNALTIFGEEKLFPLADFTVEESDTYTTAKIDAKKLVDDFGTVVYAPESVANLAMDEALRAQSAAMEDDAEALKPFVSVLSAPDALPGAHSLSVTPAAGDAVRFVVSTINPETEWTPGSMVLNTYAPSNLIGQVTVHARKVNLAEDFAATVTRDTELVAKLESDDDTYGSYVVTGNGVESNVIVTVTSKNYRADTDGDLLITDGTDMTKFEARRDAAINQVFGTANVAALSFKETTDLKLPGRKVYEVTASETMADLVNEAAEHKLYFVFGAADEEPELAHVLPGFAGETFFRTVD